MELISTLGGTHAEPGHSLTGTTPWNSFRGGELPSIVYLSEVSHNFGGKGYCFGGGYYRRGHMHSALAGSSASSAMLLGVAPPDSHSIDYHFELSRPCSVGDAVIMAFRTQIFVTRSHVALVEGLHTGNPGICGIYDSQGVRLE